MDNLLKQIIDIVDGTNDSHFNNKISSFEKIKKLIDDAKEDSFAEEGTPRCIALRKLFKEYCGYGVSFLDCGKEGVEVMSEKELNDVTKQAILSVLHEHGETKVGFRVDTVWCGPAYPDNE